MKKVPSKKVSPKPPRFNILWLWAAMFLGFISLNYFFSDTKPKEITYQEFETELLPSGDIEELIAYKRNDLLFVEVFIKKDRLTDDKYEEVRPSSNSLSLSPATGPQYIFADGSAEAFERKLNAAQEDLEKDERVSVQFKDRTNAWTGWLLSIMLPLLLIIFFWVFIMRRMSGGGGPGGQIFNIGKSKATLFDKESQVAITFNDVAGLEEAKQEVMEIVDFLKNPKKYTSLGGKIPKGALLVEEHTSELQSRENL